jgi:hypothetical protein
LVGYKLASPSKLKHFWAKEISISAFYCHTNCRGCARPFKRSCHRNCFFYFLFITRKYERAYYFSREELEEAEEIKIDLAEVSFLNKAIKKTLKNIETNSKVIINARKTSYISDDILEMIEDFANVRAVKKIDVSLEGLKLLTKNMKTINILT